MERYTTTAGEVIEYRTPDPKVRAFLARVVDAAHDPRVTEGELVELVYGKENPILDQTIFPGRGAVTKAVLADPIYQVMQDLLFAKRLQMGVLAEEAPDAAPALTVEETAARLGISAAAVRHAIKAGNLDARKEDGAYSVDPESVATYRSRVKRRGPPPESAPPDLELRFGSAPGYSFRVKFPGLEVTGKRAQQYDAVVRRFDGQGAIAFSTKSMNRMFVIEPADELNKYELGPFFISGRYRVVEKINGPKRAAERFRAFEA